MTDQHVEIRMTGHGRGTVTVDGQPIPNVISIAFRADTDNANRVTLELWAAQVDITADAQVVQVAQGAERPSVEEICADLAAGRAVVLRFAP